MKDKQYETTLQLIISRKMETAKEQRDKIIELLQAIGHGLIFMAILLLCIIFAIGFK